jgi:hypothetical protein
MQTAFIIIISFLFASIFIYIIYKNISNNYCALCPKCHKEFKASPKQLIFTVHVFDDFNLICPYCNFHGMIQLKKIKKEKE